jgi:aromatic-L-amino-acid decarboxylase
MDAKEFQDVGHRVVDLLAEYLDHIEEKRVFPEVEPRTVNQLFSEDLPQEPCSADSVLEELEHKLLPYCTNVGHPGYMGLITPSPNPMGIIADFICSAINQNVGAYSIGPSAVAMERRVVRWLTDLCGYDHSAGGNLTSGGMMANFIGLRVGRDVVTGQRAQHDGIHGRWAVYVSEERHVSIDKSVDAIGLGRNALRALPTNAEFQIQLDALEEAISKDRTNGVGPMCIVGIFRHHEHRRRRQYPRTAAHCRPRVCGCMWTPRMVVACCSRANGRCAIMASNWLIRSPSIRTSGSMLRLMPEPYWSKTRAC